MKTLSNFTVKIIISSILINFLACVNIEQPKIVKLQWQLNWLYNTTNKKISNFFSIHVELSQENARFLGINLTLNMTEKELLWKLQRNNMNLSKTTIPQYSGNFSLLNHQLLPEGSYTLCLETNNEFLLDDKKISLNYKIPEISDFPSFNEDIISTQNTQPLIILIYRNKQFFMMTYLTPNQKIPKGVEGNLFYLYTYNPDFNAGLITGPY